MLKVSQVATFLGLIAGSRASPLIPWNAANELIDPSLKPGVEDEVTVERLQEIDTEKLQSLITTEALRTHAERLFEAANASFETHGHPTRAIGTPGHNATLEYIYDTLDDLADYYDITTQPFMAMGGRIHEWSLSLSGSHGLDSKPLQMTPSVNVSQAPVQIVPNLGCLPSDYEDTEGSIVVVKRGDCAFGDKSSYAGQAGALAVLLWDPAAEPSEVFSGGSLGTPLGPEVATLGISGDVAASFRPGDKVDLLVDAEILIAETVNVIAETKGGDHENVVFLGGHSDSVLVGPGLNDNGSGLITLLEVAKQLANFKVNNAVRFAWWSAEELGLQGSLYYTDNLTRREAEKIRLFLDYDMLASPNYVYEVYDSDDKDNPNGSGELRDMFESWLTAHGHEWVEQPFDGRSDYVGFIEIGIPASGIDAGAEELKTEDEAKKVGGVAGQAYDTCYHLACDGLDNLNYDAWLVNSKLVAHSAAVYANSLRKFPERDNSFFESRVAPKRRSRDRFF